MFLGQNRLKTPNRGGLHPELIDITDKVEHSSKDQEPRFTAAVSNERWGKIIMAKTKSTQSKLPHRLAANGNLCFQGPEFIDEGFFVGSRTHDSLCVETKRSVDVLLPVFESALWDKTPEFLSPRRWVIDFRNWELDLAKRYIRCLKVLEKHVKPIRMSSSRERGRCWWQIGARDESLDERSSALTKVIAIPHTGPMPIALFAPTENTFYYDLTICCLESPGRLALLQSAVYVEWFREHGLLAGNSRPSHDLSFESFPFLEDDGVLRELGQTFYDRRSEIVNWHGQGFNQAYDDFHDPRETNPLIQDLRNLHVILDRVITGAYGLGNLDLGHGFHETQGSIRYTISEIARRDVLARLLKLNRERHHKEVKLGLIKDKARSSKGKTIAIGRKTTKGKKRT